MSALFEKVNSLRKEKELTFRELSEQSKLPMQTLFGLKRRDNVGMKVMTALADVLHVSVDELLGRSPPSNHPVTPQKLIEVPIWKKTLFGSDAAKYRYLTAEQGDKTFGIFLDSSDGYPRGTIMYFNPDLDLKSEGIVFVRYQDSLLVRRYIKDGNKVLFGHLKYDTFESYERYEILGVCSLIVTDPYSTLFDNE